jgi:5-formyltetrahydrofolate cyclo-ligase
MWEVPKEDSKLALRAAMASRRNSLSKAESFRCGQFVQANALQLPFYIAASAVALYSPIQNEVDTNDILQHALAGRREVYYPKIGRKRSIELFQIGSPAELRAGHFGILEPTGLTPLSDTDDRRLVVFVPGLAFDVRGNRLGRGKGWYDRLLARLSVEAISVALAYEFQVVDEVPTESWDQKVRYIITEQRIIECAITPAHANQSVLDASTRKGVL